jgi:pilus assembly protein Flp/PilA
VAAQFPGSDRKTNVELQGLKNGEEGQDLVEYALLVALIALVCVTGVGNVATAVNTVFSAISTSLA